MFERRESEGLFALIGSRVDATRAKDPFARPAKTGQYPWESMIHVQDLKKGMYVIDLDRPWTETSFLFPGFELRTDAELRELRRLCEYVYVRDRTDITRAPGPHPRAALKAAPWLAAAPDGEGPRAQVLAASCAVRLAPRSLAN